MKHISSTVYLSGYNFGRARERERKKLQQTEEWEFPFDDNLVKVIMWHNWRCIPTLLKYHKWLQVLVDKIGTNAIWNSNLHRHFFSLFDDKLIYFVTLRENKMVSFEDQNQMKKWIENKIQYDQWNDGKVGHRPLFWVVFVFFFLIRRKSGLINEFVFHVNNSIELSLLNWGCMRWRNCKRNFQRALT